MTTKNIQDVVFVRWQIRKNGNDGRRESAITWEYSKVHKCKCAFTTICGAEVGPIETYFRNDEVNERFDKKELCKKCFKK